MKLDSKKRMGAILILFVILLVVILVTQPKKPPKATQPVPGSEPVATKPADLPVVGNPAEVAKPSAKPGAPVSAKGKPAPALNMQVPPLVGPELLSGPPRKDIFVVTPSKKVASSGATRTPATVRAPTSSARNGIKPGTGIITQTVATPPSLKLLGTVLMHGDGAAALLEIGAEKIYVESGETIPYGTTTLTVAQVVPQEVEVVVSGGSRLLRLAEL